MMLADISFRIDGHSTKHNGRSSPKVKMTPTQRKPSPGGIYSIRNTVNGKRYVGSAVNIAGRWRDHRRFLKAGTNKCAKLQAAWNKHGEDVFEFLVLEYVEDRQELIAREQYWIDALEAVVSGYNISPTAGNTLGVKHSDEMKARTGAASTGRRHTDEYKEMMRSIMTGRKHTPEAIAKMKAAQVGRTVSPEAIAKMAATLRGRKLSDEHRASIAAGLCGRSISEAHRAKIGVAKTGAKHSEEARAKIAEARKKQVIKPHSAETRERLSQLAKAQWQRQKGIS